MPTAIPVQYRDFSGGYVDNVDGAKLQPNESPDLLNVVVDDPVGAVQPRRGYARCGTVPSGNPPTALYEYSRSDGTRRLIVSDNSTVYSTPDCQSWTTVASGLTASAQPYFSTVRDTLWIVNGSTWPMTWDGTTLTLLDGRPNTPNPAPPKCSYIEFWKERVWCGAPSGDPSAVAFSALTDTNGNDLDPSTGTLAWPASNAFEIDQNAGSRLYGIKAYRNRLYAFKDNGVWEIGFDNDFQNFVRKTYASVGSRYQTSIAEVDGALYFTGRDGIYAFDGQESVRVSRKLQGKFQDLNQPLISQNYKNWTTQTDFQAGTVSSTTLSWIPGSIYLSTRAAYLDNGTFESGTLSSWQPVIDGVGVAVSTWPSSYYSLDAGTYGSAGAIVAAKFSSGGGVCGDSSITLFDVSAATLTSVVGFGGAGPIQSYSWDISAYKTQVVRVKFQSLRGSDTAALWSSTFTAGSTLDFDYISDTAGGECGFLYLDNVSSFMHYSSGTWTSEIYNTVAVSTWGPFNANQSDNGGSTLYQIRYGTNTGAVQSMAYRTILPGSLIPAATNQVLVQLRVTETSSLDFKNSPEVEDLQIAWNSGGANTQKIYAAGWRNALWVSASSGSASTNNMIMRRAAPPLDSWTLYDLRLGPMSTFNDAFYAGASTHAAIYRIDYGTNDDGAAISWYWTSRDENFGLPNNAKYLPEVNADYRTNAACNIRVGYVQDQNTTYCVGSAPSPNAVLASGVGSRRLNFNGGPAYTYRFKVCDDQKDQAPSIIGLGGWARPIQRRGD